MIEIITFKEKSLHHNSAYQMTGKKFFHREADQQFGSDTKLLSKTDYFLAVTAEEIFFKN